MNFYLCNQCLHKSNCKYYKNLKENNFFEESPIQIKEYDYKDYINTYFHFLDVMSIPKVPSDFNYENAKKKLINFIYNK